MANFHRLLVVATWVKTVPLKSSSSSNIVKFLEDNIITRFGLPNKNTTDNASVFRSIVMGSFCSRYSITLAHSTNYYPQGNGLAESNNKNLIRIIKKTVGDNKRA